MSEIMRRLLAAATVALLAFAATITSIGHDFTYDDRGVVFDNDRVHSLSHLPRLFLESYWPAKYGGDGYRPVVLSLFSLQWAAGHGAPWIFHAVNILLAVATAVAVYWCASAILSQLGAWVAAALFAVHPVHVEVTGNVVGQSELVVALSLSLAVGVYLRRRRSESGSLSPGSVATISALFGIALLAKEHAIVLPGIFVAAELTVIPRERWRTRLRTIRPLFLFLVLISVAYLFVRGHVQSDLAGFVPYPIFRFLRMTPFDRIGTMMNEMPRVARLLLFPTHLSADYAPNDVLIANGFHVSELAGIFILVGSVVLAFVLRTRAPVVSFGIMWLAVAFVPVSNLIVPAGFVVAERTLFLPSVGVVLIGGLVAEHLRATRPRAEWRLVTIVLALLILAGLGRSISRQRVWKNNDAFFDALMVDAPNGYRAHFLFARHVGMKSQLSRMELEYRRAIRIFPYDAAITIAVADAYTRISLCAPAADLFEWSYSVAPDAAEGRYQYVWCLARLNRWDDVQREAIRGIRLGQAGDSRLLRAAMREAARQIGARGGTRGLPQSAMSAAKSSTGK